MNTWYRTDILLALPKFSQLAQYIQYKTTTHAIHLVYLFRSVYSSLFSIPEEESNGSENGLNGLSKKSRSKRGLLVLISFTSKNITNFAVPISSRHIPLLVILWLGLLTRKLKPNCVYQNTTCLFDSFRFLTTENGTFLGK